MREDNASQHDDRGDRTEQSPLLGVRPFTPYRTAELCLCALAVVLGLLYLYTTLLPLAVLLPLYCLILLTITLLRVWEHHKRGEKGGFHWLSILGWAILTCAVMVATAVYFSA